MDAIDRRTFLGRGLGAAAGVGILARPGKTRGAEGVDPEALITRAVNYLRPRQGEDGTWSGNLKEPGITALVVTALLRTGRVTPAEPVVARGLAALEREIGPKGGLSEERRSVYSTSVALMAFREANANGAYDRILKGGQEFLKAAQIDEGEGKSRDDPSYGGLSYGPGGGRPDLSNTSFFMEALRDSGLPADDPALRKALVFVSRCQNLESEFNDQPWAGKINDGGFVYNPGGPQPDAKAKGQGGGDGGLRSVAGMTYAGLKSMIHAGLTPDDPRVKAALDYIKKNYTLDENPGQGQRGLYYYYQTFARAMAMLGQPRFVDAEGREHDWRAELAEALGRRQNANGSWVNPDDRFLEGDPNIVTSYGLLALTAARPRR